MLKAAGLLAVEGTHLLQAHHVGIKLLHRVPEVVNFKPTRRPVALHAFVNVVSGDFESFHVLCVSVPQHRGALNIC
jgi:hypothetical protein